MKQLVGEDLFGQTFGRLTVLDEYKEEYGKDCKGHQTRKVIYKCRCECGNICWISRKSLKSGHTQSCGCLLHECRVERARNINLSHQETMNKQRPRLYSIWSDIKKRCYNPNSYRYEDYGGRGITMCDEWHYSYPAFKEWCESHGYADNLSIDRIDNNKGYSPDNCRWVSCLVQSNNRRSNVYYDFDGKHLTIAEWARLYNIQYGTLRNRIKHGWDFEKALITPPKF